MLVRPSQPVLLEHRAHRFGRMGVPAETATRETHDEVEADVESADTDAVWRIAEDEYLPCMIGSCREQPAIVAIAADDAVQDDDVCRLDGRWILGDVVEPAVNTLGDSGLEGERAGVVLVCGGELEVGGVGGARSEQLDLDLTDPAADLHDRRAIDAAIAEEIHHPAGGLVEPTFAVPRGQPGGEGSAEEPFVVPPTTPT